MTVIKALRSRQGMSQVKLAELMRVSRSTIAMWETGGSEPDHCALLRLADIFGVSVDELLCHTPPAPAPAPTDTVTPEYLAAHVSKYRMLDDVDRAKADAYLDGLLSADKYQTPIR